MVSGAEESKTQLKIQLFNRNLFIFNYCTIGHYSVTKGDLKINLVKKKVIVTNIYGFK